MNNEEVRSYVREEIKKKMNPYFGIFRISYPFGNYINEERYAELYVKSSRLINLLLDDYLARSRGLMSGGIFTAPVSGVYSIGTTIAILKKGDIIDV